LYWSTTGGTATVSDFSANTGSFTLINGTGSFNVTTVADATTEGSETFQVQLRTVSVTGTVVATSNVVYINDTSVSNVAPLVPITLKANSLYFDGYLTMSGVQIQFVK